MGAWGEGAFQNDNACDWRDSKLRRTLKSAITSGSPPEIFAALTLVYHSGLRYDYEDDELIAAFSKIEQYDSDSGWVNEGARKARVGSLKRLLLSGPGPEPGVMQTIMSDLSK